MLREVLTGLHYKRKDITRLEEKIKRANLKLAAGNLAFLSVALFAVLFFLGFCALRVSIQLSIIAFVSSVLALRVPDLFLDYMVRLRVKRIESDLPYALRYFAQLLELGVTPESALEKVAAMNFREFSQVLREVLAESRKGKMLERALLDMDRKIDSNSLKESTSIIVQTLRLGSGGEGCRIVRRIAQKLIDEKKHEYSTFSARSQIILLFQIIVSAILPAVIAFFITFSSIFKGGFSDLTVYAIFVLALPAVSLLEFAYLRAVYPD